MASNTAALAEENAVPETSYDAWSFTAAPYAWAAGIKGDVGNFGLPAQSIELSFGDILDILDVAVFGVFEARQDRYSIGVDLSYVKISSNVATPLGIAADNIDAKTETFMGTFYGGYSVMDDRKTRVDLIGGARVWSVDNQFRFNGGAFGGTSTSDGDTWVDPIVGIKFRTDINDRFYVSGWGMVGGFGVASDLVWDAMGVVGYEVSDVTSIIVGYRATGVDYSSGGFVYDVVQQGPVIGAAFRF